MKIKVGPRRTLNNVIKVKKYKKMKSWENNQLVWTCCWTGLRNEPTSRRIDKLYKIQWILQEIQAWWSTSQHQPKRKTYNHDRLTQVSIQVNNPKRPSLRELIEEQEKLTNNLSKKLVANDKILEDINVKIDSFSEILKDQAIFNAKLESKLSKLSVVAPIATNPEQVCNVQTRVASKQQIHHIPRAQQDHRLEHLQHLWHQPKLQRRIMT
jgi:hypothetical protein